MIYSMATMTLTERMAYIKENSNQSPISDDTSASPLSLYLALYSKASTECYIDYMEGAKVLYNWLTCKGIIPLVIPPSSVPVPRLCLSYDMVQLAKILSRGDHTKLNPITQSIYAEVTSHEAI